MGTPRRLDPPPRSRRCPDCPTRPGCSEVAWHVYSIEDAVCETCDGTGFVPDLKDPS